MKYSNLVHNFLAFGVFGLCIVVVRPDLEDSLVILQGNFVLAQRHVGRGPAVICLQIHFVTFDSFGSIYQSVAWKLSAGR